MSDPADTLAADLRLIAHRIETDEDYAMRIGEDARATLESEGVPDQVIATLLSHADAEVVGFAMEGDAVGLTVTRIAAAARDLAQ